MNHDTLSLAVKFIIRARKVAGHIEAVRLVEDVKYRNNIFEQVLAIGDADLNEMTLNLRDKLHLNESVNSSSVYKDVKVDFSEYK